jgi:hypothetical protein
MQGSEIGESNEELGFDVPSLIVSRQLTIY